MGGMDVLLRRAVPEDGPGIHTLIFEESPHFDTKGYPEGIWPANMVVLVAEGGGRVVGWLEAALDQVYEGRGAPTPPPHGYVLALVVSQAWKRLGIGRALMEMFLEEMRAAKVEWVFLIPEEGEGFPGRVRFFTRVGFDPVEEPEERPLVMGRRV